MEIPLIANETGSNKRQPKINHISDVLIPPVLKSLGLSDKELQVINERGGEFQRRLGALFTDFLWESRSPYKVIVNYDITIEEMVAAGRYDGMFLGDLPSREIAIRHLTGQVETTIYPLHFPEQFIASEWVLGQLKARHMRPANLPELLSLGAQHTDVQKVCSLHALGTVWQSKHGFLVKATLGNWWEGKRRIDASRYDHIHSGNSFEYGFDTDYFAAVRE